MKLIIIKFRYLKNVKLIVWKKLVTWVNFTTWRYISRLTENVSVLFFLVNKKGGTTRPASFVNPDILHIT